MTDGHSTLLVLAGPNGAGKSTFFDLHLKKTGLRFVNADVIARALGPSGESPYKAAQIADVIRRQLVEARESFCMETVFSDPDQEKLKFLIDARQRGYCVSMVFIGLESAELSQARVIERVERGGHDVPDDRLFARFPRTLSNLKAAIPHLDEIVIFDNSDALSPYRFVARIDHGKVAEVNPPVPRWAEDVLPK